MPRRTRPVPSQCSRVVLLPTTLNGELRFVFCLVVQEKSPSTPASQLSNCQLYPTVPPKTPPETSNFCVIGNPRLPFRFVGSALKNWLWPQANPPAIPA